MSQLILWSVQLLQLGFMWLLPPVSRISLAFANAESSTEFTISPPGNKTQSASGYTPAGTAGVITVGAVDRRDMQSGFSNYGNKLALSAPGQDVRS